MHCLDEKKENRSKPNKSANNSINTKKVFTSLFWRFAERCGAQSVSFIVSIILARLLVPEVYGTIALVTVFTAVLQVFVDSGMGNALIQKKNADDMDFSTFFYFNVTVCCVLYLGMYLAAPFIANFYNDHELTAIIRVLSLTLVISGVKNVQQPYVSRNMLFKHFFFATLGGTIGAAVIGIAMAYMGFGVWALVVQQVFNAAVDTIILWITVKWRPKQTFSLQRLSGLFSFGWKMLVSGLIDTVYGNVRQLIIGKMYSSEDLAYYNRGRQFPNFIVNNINNSIDSVLFPVMSSMQNNRESVRQMTRKAIKVSVYIMAPLMMGMAFMADTVVRLVLSEKWADCVPYLQIFCITCMFYPIHTANLNAIKAMGRSDLFLKLEIMKKGIGIILLLFTMRFGVMAMAYSLLVSDILSQIINAWPNRKLLNYSYIGQIKDVIPSILMAVMMGLCVSMIPSLGLSPVFTLFVQIIVGVFIYFIASIVFKNDSFILLRNILMSFFNKKDGL